jgi:hypothetical protein
VEQGPEGVRQGYADKEYELGAQRRKKIINFLKNKKSISSTKLTEFLATQGYKNPSGILHDIRQRNWFKDLNIKYIQDPNPMFTGEKRGKIEVPKGRKTVYNQYAKLLNKNQPKEYPSPKWDDLPYDQRQDIASIAKNNDYKFRKNYSSQLRFKSTEEKKLMDVFGLTEQNFLDHGKHGVKRTLASGKINPEYTKIHNYVQNDFKFLKKDVLDVATQRKIMNNFELPEGATEWKFNEYKYGIADTSGKNMNLGKRIANKLKEKTWRVAADTSSPQGWMMYQMTRAFDNDMRLPNGQLAYEPRYETINGKKRIVGFTDNTTYGGGKTYYGLKKWNKVHKGTDWASHADFKKTSKFVDITKRAYAQPNKIIMGLLEKGGIPRNGRLQLNHVLKFLATQEGHDIARIKNAIVKHHMGGVGAGKMAGNPTNDLQILRYTVNDDIRQIENKIRKGIYLKEDITALKNYGASVRGPDGKLYGGGSRTPIGGFKEVEKYAAGQIEKWKPEDFNKFKKFLHTAKTAKGPARLKAMQAIIATVGTAAAASLFDKFGIQPAMADTGAAAPGVTAGDIALAGAAPLATKKGRSLYGKAAKAALKSAGTIPGILAIEAAAGPGIVSAMGGSFGEAIASPLLLEGTIRDKRIYDKLKSEQGFSERDIETVKDSLMLEADPFTSSMMPVSEAATNAEVRSAASQAYEWASGEIAKEDEARLERADKFDYLQLAGGGLANLTRTVAPDSGPMSQGLSYLYNRVKKQ